MNKYIGHPYQLAGFQEYRLTGGKADGMRMLRVKNGKGLEIEISLDRCADLSQITVNGINMGYFAPCGYVHPAYYDNKGTGFLKSFTAGFLTTCGLTAVGNPCIDDGEELPLHGNISHTPVENYAVTENENHIEITSYIRDASLFSHKLILKRIYSVSKNENHIEMYDEIENISSMTSPVMILYHCNIGHPLLSENSNVVIPSLDVTPRNEHAEKDIENCLNMEEPQKDYVEKCYYHNVKENNGIAQCGIYNSDIEKGLVIEYAKETLPYFTEWKMMGEYEYVLGLEPGNCTPDGRDILRKEGKLMFIEPGEKYKSQLVFKFIENYNKFTEELKCW